MVKNLLRMVKNLLRMVKNLFSLQRIVKKKDKSSALLYLFHVFMSLENNNISHEPHIPLKFKNVKFIFQ